MQRKECLLWWGTWIPSASPPRSEKPAIMQKSRASGPWRNRTRSRNRRRSRSHVSRFHHVVSNANLLVLSSTTAAEDAQFCELFLYCMWLFLLLQCPLGFPTVSTESISGFIGSTNFKIWLNTDPTNCETVSGWWGSSWLLHCTSQGMSFYKFAWSSCRQQP